ncbi:hypothetical protein EDC04DRAFT_2608618 [Pisolithus marmoratus]|nr:hypothetical protein EDC04DRAFT_2608618 [Pisolithus marmoratus]
MLLQPKFLTKMPRRVKTLSVPQNVKAFDAWSLKEDFHSELHTSIFDKGTLPSTKYNREIIADCWFPDKILPVVPNAELLTMLMGPNGKPLYDFKPSGLQEHLERLPPTEEERELSTFMTTIMDTLIIYYESTPHSALQGAEASFPNNLAPDPPSFALHTNDMASAPTTFNPTASILNTSPLHSSSGSHSDPGAPTIPQGVEVSSHNDPALSALQPKQGISRDWSSVAATKPLVGGIAWLKPDSMLI